MTKAQGLLIIFGVLFILFLVLISFFVSLWEERKKMSQRLFSITDQNKAGGREEAFAVFKKRNQSMLEKKINTYLRYRPRTENSIRLKLYRTGMEDHIVPLFLITSLLSLALGFPLLKTGNFSSLYAFPLGTALALILIYGVLNFLERRFKKKTLEQLPVAIDIILRGIKGGSSVEKTFAIVAKEVEAPLKNEFLRIIQKIEFGVSFDEVLHEAGDRIDLSEFYFFVTALVIQRKGGGSLAEILENIVLSLTRISEIQAKIRIFSSEAKVTAMILGSLPIVIWIVMIKFNPSYLDFFRFDPLGRKLLISAALLIGGGVLTIRNLIKIKL